MLTLEEQASKQESLNEFAYLDKVEKQAKYIWDIGWEAGASDDLLNEVHDELFGY